MEVVQVNGNVIGELSRLVKKVGEQQREIVLEHSKELGKHNKLIERAMLREDRLLAKVNRIEEKMMQKELYNYTYI
jgi:proline dehydrogenase